MKWLPRTLIQGPHLHLCTSQREFERVKRSINPDMVDVCPYVNTGAIATTHTYADATSGGVLCVVGVNISDQGVGDLPNVQIACILVHEAVHVWQAFCESIGEDKPSAEFTAYGIQSIALRLMEAYVKQVVEPQMVADAVAEAKAAIAAA